MPVYEYECQKCQARFEALQSIHDKPLKKCKVCGAKVERLISQTSFALKGSGWYRDGYSKPPPAAEKSTPAKPETPVKSETKPGSKDSKVA